MLRIEEELQKRYTLKLLSTFYNKLPFDNGYHKYLYNDDKQEMKHKRKLKHKDN